MPRVLVTTDRAQRPTKVLLDERVQAVHLSNGHSATQFIERLGWAINDAEDLEHVSRRR